MQDAREKKIRLKKGEFWRLGPIVISLESKDAADVVVICNPQWAIVKEKHFDIPEDSNTIHNIT